MQDDKDLIKLSPMVDADDNWGVAQTAGPDLNDLALRSDLTKVREAVTFDRSTKGLQLIKIKFKGEKVLSIEKFKADVPQTAKVNAMKILEDIIMKAKKSPAEKD